MKELIIEMEKYASEKNIPIIEKKSIAYIMNFIKENNIKSILEIGSAIGYSSILMATVGSNITITTIEKDEQRYMECVKNVKKAEFDKRINIVYQDALEINLSDDTKYDMIFIDAAKGQYIKFFEKFKYFLKEDGFIISDNLNFHGYVGHSSELENGSLKSLVEKIEGYKDFLENNEEFTTKFIDVGDGLSISQRKKSE